MNNKKVFIALFITGLFLLSGLTFLNVNNVNQVQNHNVKQPVIQSCIKKLPMNSETNVVKTTITINNAPSGKGYYQQLLTLPITVTINVKIGNFYFTSSNGTELYAWVQSYNSSSFSVWVKIPNGTQYISMYSGYSYSFFSSNGYVGAYPTLTSIYGQYFNANKVFPFATDFNNNSTVNSQFGGTENTGSFYLNTSNYANDGLYLRYGSDGFATKYYASKNSINYYIGIRVFPYNSGSMDFGYANATDGYFALVHPSWEAGNISGVFSMAPNIYSFYTESEAGFYTNTINQVGPAIFNCMFVVGNITMPTYSISSTLPFNSNTVPDSNSIRLCDGLYYFQNTVNGSYEALNMTTGKYIYNLNKPIGNNLSNLPVCVNGKLRIYYEFLNTSASNNYQLWCIQNGRNNLLSEHTTTVSGSRYTNFYLYFYNKNIYTLGGWMPSTGQNLYPISLYNISTNSIIIHCYIISNPYCSSTQTTMTCLQTPSFNSGYLLIPYNNADTTSSEKGYNTLIHITDSTFQTQLISCVKGTAKGTGGHPSALCINKNMSSTYNNKLPNTYEIVGNYFTATQNLTSFALTSGNNSVGMGFQPEFKNFRFFENNNTFFNKGVYCNIQPSQYCYNDNMYSYIINNVVQYYTYYIYHLKLTGANQESVPMAFCMLYQGHTYYECVYYFNNSVPTFSFEALTYSNFTPVQKYYNITSASYSNNYLNITIYYKPNSAVNKYNSLSIISYINPIAEIMLFFGVSGVVVFEIRNNRRGKR